VRDLLKHVVSVVVAVGARKDEDAEFHVVILGQEAAR
jgi:hypothetical protein